ncbi:MAG: TrkH family potassium uptake protein [Bacteroidales bacterium]|nr:TrkH family potassium uptake protein [Candidatus Liminaster caballi]
MSLNWSLIRYIFGLLLIMESFFMMMSAGVGLYYHFELGETDWVALGSCGLAVALIGGLLLFSGYRHSRQMQAREGFLIVSLTWVLFSVFGMVPYLLTGTCQTAADAFLETMAGFTTTGCTTILDIEAQPHGILFWRALTQWLGGLGIVVFSLALLPMIGTGATQIFGAETNGLSVDKLRPKVQQTARRLWGIYLMLTIVNAALYYWAGMSVFDAVCHAFSTMASGGSSTHSSSIGYYHSPLIEYICIVFLFITSINYNLFYFFGIGRFRLFWKNEELRWFCGIVVGFTALFMGLNYATRIWSDSATADQIASLGDGSFECTLRTSLFHTLTIVSSGGFQSEYFDYVKWGAVFWLPTLLLMVSGGCVSSTAGGLKVVRMVVLVKNARKEILQALDPRAFTSVRLNGHILSSSVVYKILAMISIYLILVFFSVFLLQCLGLSFDTSIGAAVSAFGNTGPAMGDLGPAFTWFDIPSAAKWYLSLCMLIGRLEIFTVVLLFTPMFWKNK